MLQKLQVWQTNNFSSLHSPFLVQLTTFLFSVSLSVPLKAYRQSVTVTYNYLRFYKKFKWVSNLWQFNVRCCTLVTDRVAGRKFLFLLRILPHCVCECICVQTEFVVCRERNYIRPQTSAFYLSSFNSSSISWMHTHLHTRVSSCCGDILFLNSIPLRAFAVPLRMQCAFQCASKKCQFFFTVVSSSEICHLIT